MIAVELLNAAGELVVHGLIPPFHTLPEVIVWGDRHFQVAKYTNELVKIDGRYVYHEVFAVALVHTVK